ncbi:MAG: universal stress protein [Thermodesulfobacteriota bacterium]|nr:MAG: universal stress protein [Thermodesulfobacteriota bacterium]
MAVFNRILIPYDGSGPSRRAALKGMEIAEDQKAEVFGLKVISYIGELITPSDSLWATIEGDLRNKAAAILNDLVAIAADKGIEIKTELREGDATEEVVAYADELHADLIVLGLGGRSGMGKYLGRNVDKILREATCPVMVVR